MTPTDRAREVVLRFQQDGHPYYDELVEMIAVSIAAAEGEQRSQTRAWEATARKLATGLTPLVSSRAGDSRLTQINKERARAALGEFNRMARYRSVVERAPTEEDADAP